MIFFIQNYHNHHIIIIISWKMFDCIILKFIHRIKLWIYQFIFSYHTSFLSHDYKIVDIMSHILIILDNHDLTYFIFFHLKYFYHIIQIIILLYSNIFFISFLYFLAYYYHYLNINSKSILIDLDQVKVTFNLISTQLI